MDKNIKGIVIIILAVLVVFGVIIAGYSLLIPKQPPQQAAAFSWLDRIYAKSFAFQTAAVTNTNGTVANVKGFSAVGIQVNGVTTATITFEMTADGTNWVAVRAINLNAGTDATTTTADGLFLISVGGMSQLRARISGYSGGTITVSGYGVTDGFYSSTGVILGATTDGTYIGDINFGESLPAGTNNIGDVDVLSVAAGETHAFEVGTSSNLISVTLSLDTGIYASGDVLADRQQLDGAFRVSDGTGVLYSVMVIDLSDQAQALDLLVLQADCTLGTENSAVSIADSCADDILCVVEIQASDYVDLVNSQVAVAAPACLVEAVSGTDDLYVGAVSRGTGTYAANGLVLKVGVLND